MNYGPNTQRGGGGGRVTCICRDTGMCHYFLGLLPDFWVPFWAIARFSGIISFG